MSSSENFKPDPIPDMTLPERGDTAPSPAPMPDMTLPARAQPQGQVEKAPPAWERPTRKPIEWKPGDRVLAPWEPMFLYVGTIKSIEGIRALIEFDDGDSGWVYVEDIRKVSVELGQRVLSRRKMGALFYPGEVAQLHGDDEVLVRFEEGDEEWTRIAALRIVREDNDDNRGAEPVRVESNRVFLNSLRRGNRVWAPWLAEVLYVGTIEELRGEEAHIHFDDGDHGWVQIQQLLPFEPRVGSVVYVNYNRAGQYYPALIERIDGERLFVRVDGMGSEWTTPRALAMPTQPAGPNARPTRTVSGSPRWWILFLIIGAVVLFLLRAFLR
jgi:hypothetical protein